MPYRFRGVNFAARQALLAIKSLLIVDILSPRLGGPDVGVCQTRMVVAGGSVGALFVGYPSVCAC